MKLQKIDGQWVLVRSLVRYVGGKEKYSCKEGYAAACVYFIKGLSGV